MHNAMRHDSCFILSIMKFYRPRHLGLLIIFLLPAMAQAQVMSTYGEASYPQTAKQNTSSLMGSGGLIGSGYNDGRDQSQLTGVQLNFKYMNMLDDNLLVKIEAGVQLEAGHSQIVYNDDYQNQQRFMLTEASLKWNPIKEVDLKVGTLNQPQNHSLLLLSEVSFPGLEQNAQVKLGNFQLGARGEQAVPTSAMYSPMMSQSPGVPYFLSGQLNGGYATDAVKATAAVGVFEFGQLSPDVAQDSRFRGNTVTGLGSQGAQFVYNYQGVESMCQVAVPLGSAVTPRLSGSYVLNTAAPAGKNAGFLAVAGTEVKPGANIVLTPQFKVFRNESDSSPAYYNDRTIGHNNVRGFAAGLSAALPGSSLSFEAFWSSGSPINQNPYQSNFNIVTFKMVKSYALF